MNYAVDGEDSNYSNYRENNFISTYPFFTDLSNYNVMTNNLIFNSIGIYVYGSDGNIFAFNTILSPASGVWSGSGNHNTTIHNILNTGNFIFLFLGSDKSTFSHIVGNTITVSGGGATNTKFSGLLGINGCSVVSAPTGNGIDSSCALVAPSDGTIVNLTTVSNSTAGFINSDSHFPGYNSGAGIPYGSMTNFTLFDDFFTGLATALNAVCSPGDTCYLTSARLKSTDTVILNKSGNLATTNSAFPVLAGDPCPAEVNGSATATDQAVTPHTYLLNAMEIIGDELGNDNGLCESGEACIYAPNIGAYQGDGDYTTRTCVFQNGTVTGVQMYAYPSNAQSN